MIDILQASPKQMVILFVLIAYLSSTHASPKKVTDLLGQPCRGSFECEINQWCYHYRCDLPCAKLDCEYHSPPDGVCVVRDHQPVCKKPEELEEENQIRANGGCVTSADCSETEWCEMNAVCEDACQYIDCSTYKNDTVCEVINHHPICKPKPVPEGEKPRVLKGIGEDCKDSYDCDTELNCHEKSKKCFDPCKKLWCNVLKLPEPPAHYTGDQKTIWHHLKSYDWTCVVVLHRAECSRKHPLGHVNSFGREVDF